MKLERLRYVQRFPAELEACWRFFSDPRNLRTITPAWLGFQVTNDPAPHMYAGMIVCYRIQPFPGVRVNWITEITHAREPFFFVDEQRFGPYRFWHHQHCFREIENGVEMEDVVHYALPFGVLSKPVLYLVERRLRSIFDFRRKVLAERFGDLP